MTNQNFSGEGKTLTEGQRACLRLVAEHRTSKEIARTLGVSVATVDQRIKFAAQKLGASSRAEAARMFTSGEPPIYGKPIYDAPDVLETADSDMVGPLLGGFMPTIDRPAMKLQDPLATAYPAPDWSIALPVRTSTRRVNDLSVSARIVWVLTIAFGIVIALALMINAVEGLSRLI